MSLFCGNCNMENLFWLSIDLKKFNDSSRIPTVGIPHGMLPLPKKVIAHTAASSSYHSYCFIAPRQPFLRSVRMLRRKFPAAAQIQQCLSDAQLRVDTSPGTKVLKRLYTNGEKISSFCRAKSLTGRKILKFFCFFFFWKRKLLLRSGMQLDDNESNYI